MPTQPMNTKPNTWEADAPQQSSSMPTTETTQTNGENTMYVQVCSCGFECPIHGKTAYTQGFQDALEKDVDENTSDGYHTFKELYDHRITLYIALGKKMQRMEYSGDIRNHGEEYNHKVVWRSKRHSDGEICFGTGTQFILGINREKGKQISYHIPIDLWNKTDFAETLEKAPKWDGHTSQDVLDRLASLKDSLQVTK